MENTNKQNFIVGAIVNEYKEVEVCANSSDEAEKIVKEKYGCNLVEASAIPVSKIS